MESKADRDAEAPSPDAARPDADRRIRRWHLLLVSLTSIEFESFFIRHGINKLDEGWPLYAAMQLRDGGVLYRDVFWVFPPGHLIPALLGTWIEPPGLVWTRVIYAAFAVALCPALYLLGRRLMPPRFAFLGALLVAVADPRSHMIQALFGYRYLVLPVLALLAFDRRLRTGRHIFTFVAGLVIGVAVVVRITPAFATSFAIGVAVLAASRSWKSWLADWGLYAAGLLLVATPVCAWFGSQVGLVHLFREAIVHPVEMLQPLPWPELVWPDEWSRAAVSELFVNLGFRVYWVLYGGYALVLGGLWLRALVRREPFQHVLLLAVVLWGGIFFVRSTGRSDFPHLGSVLPPICLLLAHLLYVALSRLRPLAALPRRPRVLVESAVAAAAFAGWVFVNYSDFYIRPANRGLAPLQVLDGRISLWGFEEAEYRDDVARAILERTEEDDVLLDMSASPMFHVLTGRRGPGYLDVIMPGTFPGEPEQRALIDRLEKRPPALVLLRRLPFDGMVERAERNTAPLVSEWVATRYEGIPYRDYTTVRDPFYVLLRPRKTPLAEIRPGLVVDQLLPDRLRGGALPGDVLRGDPLRGPPTDEDE